MIVDVHDHKVSKTAYTAVCLKVTRLQCIVHCCVQIFVRTCETNSKT